MPSPLRPRVRSALYAADVLSSFWRVDVVHVEELPVGSLAHARGPLVNRIEILVVPALELGVLLASVEGPCEMDPHVLVGIPVGEEKAAAVGAEGFVNQKRRTRPWRTAERDLVQCGEDVVKIPVVSHLRVLLRQA